MPATQTLPFSLYVPKLMADNVASLLKAIVVTSAFIAIFIHFVCIGI
jgi:hypothetical protein